MKNFRPGIAFIVCVSVLSPKVQALPKFSTINISNRCKLGLAAMVVAGATPFIVAHRYEAYDEAKAEAGDRLINIQNPGPLTEQDYESIAASMRNRDELDYSIFNLWSRADQTHGEMRGERIVVGPMVWRRIIRNYALHFPEIAALTDGVPYENDDEFVAWLGFSAHDFTTRRWDPIDFTIGNVPVRIDYARFLNLAPPKAPDYWNPRAWRNRVRYDRIRGRIIKYRAEQLGISVSESSTLTARISMNLPLWLTVHEQLLEYPASVLATSSMTEVFAKYYTMELLRKGEESAAPLAKLLYPEQTFDNARAVYNRATKDLGLGANPLDLAEPELSILIETLQFSHVESAARNFLTNMAIEFGQRRHLSGVTVRECLREISADATFKAKN